MGNECKEKLGGFRLCTHSEKRYSVVPFVKEVTVPVTKGAMLYLCFLRVLEELRCQSKTSECVIGF